MGSLTFYFDVCFGKRFPETLLKARPPFLVEYHGNKGNRFKQDISDDKWLSAVGSKGWIAFSHDRKWHYEQPAIEAIRQHKIGCFYLPGANDDTWTKLHMFMRAHHRIMELAANAEKPFIFHLTALNKIEQVRLK
jgi:hypothetical protein